MQKKDQVFLYIKDEIEKISSAEEKEILDEAKAIEQEAYNQLRGEAEIDAKHQLDKELAENGKMRSDAAIAMVSASSLAIGVIVTSLTTGLSTDIYSYMFGSILAMSKDDVVVSGLLSVIVIIMFVACYHKIFAVTFDENFSKATGVKVGMYNTLISIFTAITIVVGIKMMGAMLISSLIVFPSLTSMRIFKSFKSVTICSAILSVVNFTIGLICSYGFSIPAGASVVVANLIMYIIFAIVAKVKTM